MWIRWPKWWSELLLDDVASFFCKSSCCIHFSNFEMIWRKCCCFPLCLVTKYFLLIYEDQCLVLFPLNIYNPQMLVRYLNLFVARSIPFTFSHSYFHSPALAEEQLWILPSLLEACCKHSHLLCIGFKLYLLWIILF